MADITNFRRPLFRSAQHGVGEATDTEDLTAVSAMFFPLRHRKPGPARRALLHVLLVLPSNLRVRISDLLQLHLKINIVSLTPCI